MSVVLGRVSLGESQLIAGADFLHVPTLCVCACFAVICSQACKSSAVWQCCDAFELNLCFSKIAHDRVDWSLCCYRHSKAFKGIFA